MATHTNFSTHPGMLDTSPGFDSSSDPNFTSPELPGMAGFESPSIPSASFTGMPPSANPSDSNTPLDIKPDISASKTDSDVPADTLYQKLGLSPNLVKVVNRDANSRQNLASKLVQKVYSRKERDTCNVHGRKGKKRLDPERMTLVRRLTYLLRPLKPGENEDENWRKTCCRL